MRNIVTQRVKKPHLCKHGFPVQRDDRALVAVHGDAGVVE